ncbi:glycerophosphodiester phosphodiesterase GDPD6 isoform X2 [Manduca sexta]|uniref:glycerophosphodiester phosphodiesterase GDPD6 isoform X2 n=1 Tax=Manduca sexta TaxID=7130 RepID=UPI0018901541|nr:glycerophosphodiester phosphodiesterase GDPD6 isoform X2 [Manduca sexta]
MITNLGLLLTSQIIPNLPQDIETKQLMLYESDKSLQPFDQVESGTGLTYGNMASPEGLQEVATYAHAVGPDKSYIIPRDSNERLGQATSFVSDAHQAGLKVHPYTFRAENSFLPAEFRSADPSPSARGDFEGEIRAFLDAGIDGLFSDQPDVPARVRGACVK